MKKYCGGSERDGRRDTEAGIRRQGYGRRDTDAGIRRQGYGGRGTEAGIRTQGYGGRGGLEGCVKMDFVIFGSKARMLLRLAWDGV